MLEGGPTLVEYDPRGRLVREEWVVGEKGELSRTDGPADRYYDTDGNLHEERWFTDNELHREDGPAVTVYYAGGDGRVAFEKWFHHGTSHRVGGPARIDWSRAGEVEKEDFLVHGVFSRIDGPARRNEITSQSWNRVDYRLDGKPFGSLDYVLDRVLAHRDPELRKHVENSALHPLLDRYPARRIVETLREGVTTVEGIAAVLDGAPVEWARSFESASAPEAAS